MVPRRRKKGENFIITHGMKSHTAAVNVDNKEGKSFGKRSSSLGELTREIGRVADPNT